MRIGLVWWVLLLLCLWASYSHAFMSPKLTQANYDTLKADILADSSLASAVANNFFDQIAAAYNTDASPAFWAWKTSLPRDGETGLLYGTSVDGTTWIFEGNGFQGRTVPELLNFNVIFDNEGRVTDPSLPSVRNLFTSSTGLMSGAGNAANNRAHFLAIARRLVHRVEKLFATGTGTPASPATMAHAGTLTVQEVSYALLGGTMP
jgi:hypothetical protein